MDLCQQSTEFHFLNNFIYLFFYLTGSLLLQGLSLVATSGLLIAVAFLVAEHRLLGAQALVVAVMGSVVVAPVLNYSASCGIFLDQGSNPCSLHWHVDSYPLHHQERPEFHFLNGE